MPREMWLVTTEAVTPELLIAAAAEVDPQLAPRSIFDGLALQLLDLDDDTVLTIESSRQIEDVFAVEAVLLRQLPLTGAAWWTEATASWRAPGDVGVAIMRRLAELTSGWLVVWDGR